MSDSCWGSSILVSMSSSPVLVVFSVCDSGEVMSISMLSVLASVEEGVVEVGAVGSVVVAVVVVVVVGVDVTKVGVVEALVVEVVVVLRLTVKVLVSVGPEPLPPNL